MVCFYGTYRKKHALLKGSAVLKKMPLRYHVVDAVQLITKSRSHQIKTQKTSVVVQHGVPNPNPSPGIFAKQKRKVALPYATKKRNAPWP
ncbi:MAG: hypothetical protein CL854_07285 [Cryomorphaceae bacterium]|nr:hypothetical protein [Cryomorphaceae bacterium]